ncbi:MAG: transposase [Bacteroidota bacterium]|nr:transposase [Bacteroidota bacterium]
MTLFKNKYRSESHRLYSWDYSQAAIYFLTVCIEEQECLLGEIENNQMILNGYGQIVEQELKKSIEIRDNMKFHVWVIMPNHIHILVEIIHPVDTHSSAYPNNTPADDMHIVDMHSSAYPNDDTHVGAYVRQRKSKSISSFISGIKSTTTKQINLKRNTPFRKVWQNNYHDHIVRDENSFYNIFEYIEDNPANWKIDEHKI